jgi:hypothetical protein
MATGNTSSVKPPVNGQEPKSSSTALAWWCIAAALLVGLFFVVRPPADPEEELVATRRQQIQAMSAAERERLEANLARFEELPAERREALRDIENAVREDEGLAQTLADFERWLNTLSPWERLELRNAKTVE